LPTICGAADFIAMARFGLSKKKCFESFLDMPNAILRHDTFNDVINRLIQESFLHCFNK